jgi:type II restriction enzyme
MILKQFEKREKTNKKRHFEITNDVIENNDHTEMQYHLARLGQSLGYDVWLARNDHKREWNNRKLGEFSLKRLDLDDIPPQVKDTISLIDVLWLNKNGTIVCAFEVEKSTSIYSGILRLYDLSLSMNDQDCKFYLVAPNKREKEIKAQLLRPSFQHDYMCSIAYILFSDLRCDCDAMCKFGTNSDVLDKIAFSI